MEKKIKKINSLAIISIVLFILIVISAIIFYFIKNTKDKKTTERDGCKYAYIDPTRCNDEDAIVQPEYSIFKEKLLKELDEEKQKGNITEAALYFRDLENGPIFYFNEQSNFMPMSLLKLPTVMAIYKLAEKNENILQEKIKTPLFAENVQIMKKEETIESDREYSIEELTSRTIQYSDNRSLKMLEAWLEKFGNEQEVLRTLMNEIGILDYNVRIKTAEIRVKQYASLFRNLYNAAYLSPKYSERLLEDMSHSDFNEGLTGKLPQGIVVAHKFGVRDYKDGKVQLHDCGIIYHPQKPYILCIMTRGEEYEKISNYIQKTSLEIFNEVSKK